MKSARALQVRRALSRSLEPFLAGRAKAGFQQPTPKARDASKCPQCGRTGLVALASRGVTAYRCSRATSHPQWRVWAETWTPDQKQAVTA